MSKRTGSGLGVPLMFVHVPRCAGTSVANAIRSAMKLSEKGRIDPIRLRKSAELIVGGRGHDHFFQLYPLIQQCLLAYLLDGDDRFVSGHLPVSSAILTKYASSYCFIVTIRDPVERWISHYVFNKLVNLDPLVPPVRDCPCDPQKELELILEGPRGWQLGHLTTTMLSGVTPLPRNSNMAVEQAIDNLRHFSLIGFVEHLPAFATRFEEVFGVRLQLLRENSVEEISTDRAARNAMYGMFTEDIRQKIRDLCRDDYRVYEKARSQFL